MRWRSAAWPAEFFGASSFARFTVARRRVCQKAWDCFYPCETAACIGPGDYIPSPPVDPPHDRDTSRPGSRDRTTPASTASSFRLGYSHDTVVTECPAKAGHDSDVIRSFPDESLGRAQPHAGEPRHHLCTEEWRVLDEVDERAPHAPHADAADRRPVLPTLAGP